MRRQLHSLENQISLHPAIINLHIHTHIKQQSVCSLQYCPCSSSVFVFFCCDSKNPCEKPSVVQIEEPHYLGKHLVLQLGSKKLSMLRSSCPELLLLDFFGVNVVFFLLGLLLFSGLVFSIEYPSCTCLAARVAIGSLTFFFPSKDAALSLIFRMA